MGMKRVLLLNNKKCDIESINKVFEPHGIMVCNCDPSSLSLDLQTKALAASKDNLITKDFYFEEFGLFASDFDAMIIHCTTPSFLITYLSHIFFNKPIFGVNPMAPHFNNSCLSDVVAMQEENFPIIPTYVNPDFELLDEKKLYIKKYHAKHPTVATIVPLYPQQMKSCFNAQFEYVQEYLDFLNGQKTYKICTIDYECLDFMIDDSGLAYDKKHHLYDTLCALAKSASRVLDRASCTVEFKAFDNGVVYINTVTPGPDSLLAQAQVTQYWSKYCSFVAPVLDRAATPKVLRFGTFC